MNTQQQKDVETLLEVADVEFNLTDNTCLLTVPIKVPRILESVLLKFYKKDAKLLAHVMGELFLKVIRRQLKGGEQLNGNEEGGIRFADTGVEKSF